MSRKDSEKINQVLRCDWLPERARAILPLEITRCPFTRYRKFSPQTMQTFHTRALKRSKNSRYLPKEKKKGT